MNLTGPEESVLSVSLPDAPMPADQSSSSATVAEARAQDDADKREQQTQNAEQQSKKKDQSIFLRVISAFGTSYPTDDAPLKSSQKMKLAFESAANPLTFATAFVVAGYHEAMDDYGAGYGWGPAGFGKRVGAAYVDSFTSTIIGSGILPAVLRQDPRYFRLGQGTITHRTLYAAAASTVICKGDVSKKWQPNYSALGGAVGSAAISNIYYPADQSGWTQTAQNAAIVTGEDAVFGIFREFWPDVSRKLFHSDPTHGRDARVQREARELNQSREQSRDPEPR